MSGTTSFSNTDDSNKKETREENAAMPGLGSLTTRASISNVKTTTEDPSVGVRLVLEHQSKALNSGTAVIYSKSMGNNAPPIVSSHEIKAAKELYPGRVHGSKILQLSDSRILKVGSSVRMGEAEALELVSRKTSIPAPRVHNAYMIGDVGYILMDMVHGTPLTDCWDKMSNEECRSTVEQLRNHVNDLRSIEGGFIGAVDGGPCDEVLFKHHWGQASPTYGPFSSREDFNRGVAAALRNSRPHEVFTEADKALEADILASGSGSAEKIVLTHGDLNRGNIMVHGGSVIAIVDWGAAGYSISEMEYFSAKLTSDDASWDAAIKSFIPVFEKECEFWQKVNNQMTVYTGM